MEAKDLVGWSASLILLMTILNQIYTQWKRGSSEGVSWFLFAGQFFASLGFVTYSVMVEDLVFAVTNFLLLVSHVGGFFLTWHQKSAAANGN